MVIKASSEKEIETLLADLGSDQTVKVDSAIARLTVIGARAVGRLMTLAARPGGRAATRIAAFRALEQIGDPRALDAALAATADANVNVAVAAVAVAATFLTTSRELSVLDHISTIALEAKRPVPVRLAALRALTTFDPVAVQPLQAVLARDPNPEIAAAAKPATPSGEPTPTTILQDAAAGRLPDSAAMLKHALAVSAADVSVTALHAIVEMVAARERSGPPSQRAEWTTARAAAHMALAQRGSRLGIYDLRETIAGANEPIAVEFLSAVTAVGDESCLEALAAAYAKTTAAVPRNEWWRSHLADAFRAIVRRDGLTKRHGVIRRLRARWGDALAELWP